MPSQPWQLLAALSALQEKPANPLSWWYGGCGQAGMWAELSVEASSGSSCSGRGVPPWSGGVQQQQATAQLEAAGGSWRHLETAVTAFPSLHVRGPWAGRALQAPRTGAHPRHRQVDNKSSSGQLGVLNAL